MHIFMEPYQVGNVKYFKSMISEREGLLLPGFWNCSHGFGVKCGNVSEFRTFTKGIKKG